MKIDLTEDLITAMIAAKYIEYDRPHDWIAIQHGWQAFRRDMREGKIRVPANNNLGYETVPLSSLKKSS